MVWTCGMFVERVRETKRRGIPKRTCEDGIKNYLRKREINWERVREIFGNRVVWRKICKSDEK